MTPTTTYTRSPKRIVLPADVYDTLELAAEAHGGIGAGLFYRYEPTPDGELVETPVCALGLADFAARPAQSTNILDNPVTRALRSVGLGAPESDLAVHRVHHRRGVPRDVAVMARVSFKAWARELGVVRGEG